MSDYGKKGGTSVNSGRKARIYEATTPDGTVLRKKTFQVDADTAVMMVFKDPSGTWVASAVTAEPKDWGTQQAITATRVA